MATWTWHKLQTPNKKVAHYELMIPNTHHAKMGYGAFVEYHYSQRMELKYMWLHYLNIEKKEACKRFECQSFKQGKAMVVAFLKQHTQESP